MDRSRQHADVDVAAANEANLCTFMALQEGMTGAEVRHSEHATWVANASAMFWFNMAAGLRLGATELDGWISELQATHRRLGTSVMLWVSPAAHGASDALTAAGIEPGGETPAMAADLSRVAAPEPDAGVSLERVGDADTLAAFARTLCEGFGAPEYAAIWTEFYARLGLDEDAAVQNVLARVDGVPAAAGTVSMSDGVAGVYCVATLPEFRRRGLGAAVTKAALDLARDRGYATAVLQSSELGLGVYRAMGFEETFRYRMHHWSPSTQAA